MKKIFDKIGYSFYIGLYLFLVFNYGNLSLFETIYLVFGDKVDGKVVEQSSINGKIIYRFSYLDEEVKKTCKSFPTKAKLNFNETKKIRIVPFYNIALLHSFNFIAYFVSLAFFLLGSIVSIICILFLFNINNKITLRILKNSNNQIST